MIEDGLYAIIKEGLPGIKSTTKKMKEYPNKVLVGQYRWIDDVERSFALYENIENG